MAETENIEEVVAELTHYINNHEVGDSLKFLVAGKMGVGKSTLINSLARVKLAEEGSSADAVTQEVTRYDTAVKGRGKNKDFSVTLWDSPGFGDAFASAENQEKLIRDLIHAIEQVHFLIYCFDIRQRLMHDDVRGLVEITKRMGPEIWRHAIFVLTFSNNPSPPPDCEKGSLQFFKDKFTSWQDSIIRALKVKAEVPDEIVANIAVAAAGYRAYQPPGYRDWFTTLWCRILHKIKDSGKPFLLKIIRFKEYRGDLSELEDPKDGQQVDVLSPLDQPGKNNTGFSHKEVGIFLGTIVVCALLGGAVGGVPGVLAGGNAGAKVAVAVGGGVVGGTTALSYIRSNLKKNTHKKGAGNRGTKPCTEASKEKKE